MSHIRGLDDTISFEGEDIQTENMNPLLIAIYFEQSEIIWLFMEQFSLGVISKCLFNSEEWMDRERWLQNSDENDIFGLKLSI